MNKSTEKVILMKCTVREEKPNGNTSEVSYNFPDGDHTSKDCIPPQPGPIVPETNVLSTFSEILDALSRLSSRLLSFKDKTKK